MGYDRSSKFINSRPPFALGPMKMFFQREPYVMMFRVFAVSVQGSLHGIDGSFFTAVLLLLFIMFFSA